MNENKIEPEENKEVQEEPKEGEGGTYEDRVAGGLTSHEEENEEDES